MTHKVTSYIVHLRPLLEHEHNAQDDKCRCEYAHPAHETMRLSTAETNVGKTNEKNESEKSKDANE